MLVRWSEVRGGQPTVGVDFRGEVIVELNELYPEGGFTLGADELGLTQFRPEVWRVDSPAGYSARWRIRQLRLLAGPDGSELSGGTFVRATVRANFIGRLEGSPVEADEIFAHALGVKL